MALKTPSKGRGVSDAIRKGNRWYKQFCVVVGVFVWSLIFTYLFSIYCVCWVHCGVFEKILAKILKILSSWLCFRWDIKMKILQIQRNIQLQILMYVMKNIKMKKTNFCSPEEPQAIKNVPLTGFLSNITQKSLFVNILCRGKHKNKNFVCVCLL